MDGTSKSAGPASGVVFALGENSNIAAAHAGLDLSPELVKRLDAITK